MADSRTMIVPGLGNFRQVPGGRQLLLLMALSMSIAIGVTAAFWLREPSYELLYSNLSSRDTSEIMDALRAEQTPYRLDGGSLLVPSNEVYSTRMRLSSQGLPRGSGFGLEIIEGESGFSTSQFMENARYHHAIETELARTISNLAPVQNARVHLALPRPSVFVRRQNAPSASVLLDLYPGRNLEETQIAAIVHLVAASIPDLESSRVTVVDQRGRLLSALGDSTLTAMTTREFEYVERLQDTYASRIIALLTPMMGPGRVQATVNATVDFTQREQTREEFNPESRVVRSEQVSQDTQRDGALASQGIPGALSNQPPGSANARPLVGPEQPPSASPPMRESLQSTRNYELDRTLSSTREPGSTLTRLSVAVLVDHVQEVDEDTLESFRRPLSEDELAEIESLVKGAVGFNEQRGDTLSITNRSFFESPEQPELEGPGFLAQPLVRDILRQLPAAALLLVIGLGVIRPLVMALGSQGAGNRTAPALPPQGSPVNPAPGGTASALSYDDKVSVAKSLASKDPERVAQVVRAWVQDGSR